MSIPPYARFSLPAAPVISKGQPLDLPTFSVDIAPLDIPPPPPLPSTFLAPSNYGWASMTPPPQQTSSPPEVGPSPVNPPQGNPSAMPLSPETPPASDPVENPLVTPNPPSPPKPSDLKVDPPASSGEESEASSEVSAPPPAQNPDPSPTPTEPTPPSPAIPTPVELPPNVRGFDDGIMRSLNLRLEDPDWMRRVDAANDFFIILSANPNLEKRPQFKPYVDAFALKILRDPSAVVHEAMLRAMQVGCYRYPSPEVLNELNRLRDSVGMLGLEAQIVDDAISGIQKSQLQDAQDAQNQQKPQTSPLQPTSDAKTKETNSAST